MQRLIVLGRTAWRVGVWNVLRVLSYRMLKRAGFYRLLLPAKPPLAFALPLALGRGGVGHSTDPSVLEEADRLRSGFLNYFSVHEKNVGSPPHWFLNPFSGRHHSRPLQHWSAIPDISGDGE